MFKAEDNANIYGVKKGSFCFFLFLKQTKDQIMKQPRRQRRSVAALAKSVPPRGYKTKLLWSRAVQQQTLHTTLKLCFARMYIFKILMK